ncbi:MAG: c-type cytochrome [Dokdonella sp.]
MTQPNLLFSLLVAAVGLAVSPAVTAQDVVPASVSPPGRLLASNCFQCHGTDGKGPGFDKLAGKSASKLFKEMKDYQSGKEGEGIMARHAMGYSDAQLRELSQWLSQQQR